MRRTLPIDTIVFVWDNFGPMHTDRCAATSSALSGSAKVVGVEIFEKSDVYAWDRGENETFKKITLFRGGSRPSALLVWIELIRAYLKCGRGAYFLCHYETLPILLFSVVLRLTGSRVFTMNDSKLDDRPRSAIREFFKRAYLAPYQGALSSGTRSADYFRFLGVRPDRIIGQYDTLSTERIQRQSGTVPAPNGTSFEDREFICIARLVPKKNLKMLVDAYQIYHRLMSRPRRLVLCGSGPLEPQLRQEIDSRGLSEFITLKGFVQTNEISQLLGNALALLLPSVEEQFGLVVIEAQAMGLPVIISENCGARDLLVRSAVNGFVVEPDNPDGFAWFMSCLSEDEALWRRMAEKSLSVSKMGDVTAFVAGVSALALPQSVPQPLKG